MENESESSLGRHGLKPMLRDTIFIQQENHQKCRFPFFDNRNGYHYKMSRAWCYITHEIAYS